MTKSALALLPNIPRELPYEGTRKMLLVEDSEDRRLLQKLFKAIWDELPEPKKRRQRN